VPIIAPLPWNIGGSGVVLMLTRLCSTSPDRGACKPRVKCKGRMTA
jgi:hypothetical protein